MITWKDFKFSLQLFILVKSWQLKLQSRWLASKLLIARDMGRFNGFVAFSSHAVNSFTLIKENSC